MVHAEKIKGALGETLKGEIVTTIYKNPQIHLEPYFKIEGKKIK